MLAGAVPDFAEGAFSILAWVNGETPDQVILSQQAGADWLCTNPLDGSLMSGLSVSGRNATALFSEAVVTDGQWHRIALVWDGTDCILYVDEQEVARDAQSELDVSSADVLLGGGGKMAPVPFFSGLIDDVRIYSRAVRP